MVGINTTWLEWTGHGGSDFAEIFRNHYHSISAFPASVYENNAENKWTHMTSWWCRHFIWSCSWDFMWDMWHLSSKCILWWWLLHILLENLIYWNPIVHDLCWTVMKTGRFWWIRLLDLPPWSTCFDKKKSDFDIGFGFTILQPMKHPVFNIEICLGLQARHLF